MTAWRVGSHYGIHVYEGDRPVATFHDAADARRCVEAVNAEPPTPPLYVNHPRTEPVPGDVVRNADVNCGDETRTWFLDYVGHWRVTRAHKTELSGCNLPARLRLLVDGETGQVVP